MYNSQIECISGNLGKNVTNKKPKIDFGFESVDKDKKASLVHDVFESVASKYDIMNDVMSGGLHRIWKNKTISMIAPFDGAKLLDVAGGTGDISFRFIRKAKKLNVKTEVTISDINDYMLEEGRARAIDDNIIEGVKWQVADAEKLPFKDESYDFLTIAFGIRNVTDKDQALKEFYRVLKVGGRFVCLEFSNVENPIFAKIYNEYSMKMIPKIGGVITGDKDSYRYLVESIRKFPTRNEFSEMIKNAGFEHVTSEPLTQGVVAIHSGIKA